MAPAGGTRGARSGARGRKPACTPGRGRGGGRSAGAAEVSTPQLPAAAPISVQKSVPRPAQVAEDGESDLEEDGNMPSLGLPPLANVLSARAVAMPDPPPQPLPPQQPRASMAHAAATPNPHGSAHAPRPGNCPAPEAADEPPINESAGVEEVDPAEGDPNFHSQGAEAARRVRGVRWNANNLTVLINTAFDLGYYRFRFHSTQIIRGQQNLDALDRIVERLRHDMLNFPVVPQPQTLSDWLDKAVAKRIKYTKGDFTGDGNDPFIEAFGSRFDPTALNIALDNYIAEGSSKYLHCL